MIQVEQMVGSRRKKNIPTNSSTMNIKNYLFNLYSELIDKTEDFMERSNYKFILSGLKENSESIFNCLECNSNVSDINGVVCERCLKPYHKQKCLEKHICKIRSK